MKFTGTILRLFILLNFFIVSSTDIFSQSKDSTPNNKIYFKFTIDLPGKTDKSYVKGTYKVKSGSKLISSGEFLLEGLRSEEDRIFKTEIAAIDTIDLAGDGLEWSHRCKIYDSKLDEILDTYSWNMSTLGKPIEGIGFKVLVDENKHITNNNLIFSERKIKEQIK